MKRFCVLLVVVSWFAWSGVLSFWFFKAYEPSWFMGVPHTFGGLYRSHAYLYFLNYKLFGWNPAGWYATALVLHTLASLLLFGYLCSLTKSLRLAGLAALFFVASPGYQDVLTWGSFNSYYALLLSSAIASLWFYHHWRYSLKKRFLFGSLFFAFLAFFIRESALALIGVIIFAELTIYHRTKTFKPFEIFKKIVPFIGVALIYGVVRHFMGGVYGDSADDSVQLRISLLHDHLYLQFIWRVTLAFGRHFAGLWIPYEWLNTVRAFLVDITHGSLFLQKYFFSIIGWVVAGILGSMLYRLRKTKIFPFLLFAFGWSVLWILITAYAMPSSDTVLAYDYFWNTRRYMYYAYVGVALWWSILCWGLYENIQKHLPRLRAYIYPGFVGLMGLIVLINIFWLRAIEKGLLVSVHAQSRAFYASFQKEFPEISKDYAIYYYPFSDGLNDYLYEWSFLKGTLYPNLKDAPFPVEDQLARILEKISKGVYRLDNVLFVGYSIANGVRNEGERVKDALRNVGPFEADGVAAARLPEGKFPVEIPYIIRLGYVATPYGSSDYETQQFVGDRSMFLTRASVAVSATMSQRGGEPFLHLLPTNLIDGDFGRRSGWIADSIPAVVTIDLGSLRSIGALWWSSQEGVRVPSSYRIEISPEGSKWENVISVRVNTQISRIDFFEKPVTARFVRMSIDTTTTGAFAYLDELEVIGEEGIPFAKRYRDPTRMIHDSITASGQPSGFAKFIWTTNMTTSDTPPQEKLLLVIPDGLVHEIQFKLPEMEIFSQRGKFLKKFITGFTITPVSPFYLNIEYVTLKPQYEIADTK
jgi:hypothetical protein